MKKILAALLAISMLAALCVVSVSAWSDAAEEANWTRHSIFDDALVDLFAADGSAYPIPASYDNGQNDGSFQFWKDAGHLYQEKGLNVMNGAKVSITFKGTGIKLCTAYRNDGGFETSQIGATLDGADVSSSLKDLIAPTNNNTDHTPILTLTGLAAGEHTVTFTCTSASYRFSLDYFDIENEGAEAPAAPTGDGKVVKMFGFDTQKFGTLDTEGHVDGTGCNSYTFNDTVKAADTFVVKFDTPIDLSECDYVDFWFYASDASKLSLYKGAQIELTSSGTCDAEEATWNLPAAWNTIIEGGPKDGWNLIHLDINKTDDNHADWSKINFFRMYTLDPQNLDGLTIKFDDMYAYAEGAEVPAPQKGTTPTPATFDAVSSVAVVAVAALGVALVASKKRH
ncbi:MAG: hypothetical protein MJ070_07260 [Lachnospiraceae bacterium]|nr:hypothetical protein [Lachnospiraceae bacterium]